MAVVLFFRQPVKGIDFLPHGHVFVEAVAVFFIEDFVRDNQQGETAIPVVGTFGRKDVRVVATDDFGFDSGIVLLLYLVAFVLVSSQRIQQSGTPEGFIEDGKLAMVLIQ